MSSRRGPALRLLPRQPPAQGGESPRPSNAPAGKGIAAANAARVGPPPAEAAHLGSALLQGMGSQEVPSGKQEVSAADLVEQAASDVPGDKEEEDDEDGSTCAGSPWAGVGAARAAAPDGVVLGARGAINAGHCVRPVTVKAADKGGKGKDKGKSKGDSGETLRISKAMSFFLRHSEELAEVMLPDGWVREDNVIDWLQRNRYHPTSDIVADVIASQARARFERGVDNAGCRFVRATRAERAEHAAAASREKGRRDWREEPIKQLQDSATHTVAVALKEAKLERCISAARQWCDDQGAATLAEVIDSFADFADALDLKPMERTRLLRVLQGREGFGNHGASPENGGRGTVAETVISVQFDKPPSSASRSTSSRFYFPDGDSAPGEQSPTGSPTAPGGLRSRLPVGHSASLPLPVEDKPVDRSPSPCISRSESMPSSAGRGGGGRGRRTTCWGKAPAPAARGKGGRGGYRASSFVQGVTLAGPEYWAITVKQLCDLWSEIRDDMLLYCSDHQVDDRFRHICRQVPCHHDHHGAAHLPTSALEDQDLAGLHDLEPTMHVVVGRYIKPQTASAGCSYARMLNKGCERLADVFISHCWNHTFGDFVSTLRDALEQEDAVWICSFALDQNSDITAELGSDVQKSPFAVALKESSEVILVIDGSAEPLTRSWCVYEMYLATLLGKKLDVWTHNWSPKLFRQLTDRVTHLDVGNCSASNPKDHARIMQAIKGKEDDVNTGVRRSVVRAMKKVEAMSKDLGSPGGANDCVGDLA